MSTRVSKVWGSERILFNGPLCCKILRVKPGMQCSFHYHNIKIETFMVLKGDCILEGNGQKRVLQHGENVHIPNRTAHRFGSEKGCILLEVSTHHDDADVSRLEPSGPIPR